MSTYKLKYDIDLDESCLIAIQTNIDLDRLAYFINKNNSLFLNFSNQPIKYFKKNRALEFFKFFYDDVEDEYKYYLFENQTITNDVIDNLGLFENEALESRHYFLEQFKKVNYFLKIIGNDAEFQCKKLIENLKSIKHIDSLSLITLDKIKNTNDLIFD